MKNKKIKDSQGSEEKKPGPELADREPNSFSVTY